MPADRLDAKLGWLRDHRVPFSQWGAMMAVVEPTAADVRTALEHAKHEDRAAWRRAQLGPSVQAQRRQALLPLVPGTKTG